MKQVLLIFILIFSSLMVRSQNKDDLKLDTIKHQKSLDNNKIYTRIQTQPEFPNGMGEFIKYISKNLHIPADQTIKGRVVVYFVVGLEGEIENTKIIEGILTEGAKREVLRVFNESPKWKPGIQNSRPVKVSYTVPLNFPSDNNH